MPEICSILNIYEYLLIILIDYDINLTIIFRAIFGQNNHIINKNYIREMVIYGHKNCNRSGAGQQIEQFGC